jgi:phytoene/squalene synthetase
LSDAICTGLQLLEHIGDVAEDARAGRVYLPAWDLARFGVHPEDLLGPPAGPAVVALLRFEIERAARWLRQGSALVGTLHGAPRAAVAGFVAGGLAAADAVRAAGGAVLAGAPRPSRVALARHFAVIVTRGAARGAAR